MLKKNHSQVNSMRWRTCRFKTHAKTISNNSTSTTNSRRFVPCMLKAREIMDLILPKISCAWQMIGAMGMEASEPTILKYLKKRMEARSFQFIQLILEVLKTRAIPKHFKEIEEFNMTILTFQIEQMKQELEGFLIKRFGRDLEIMKGRIEQTDLEIKDCIDIDQYERLVCSFRPLLITKATDLAQEYQALSGTTTPRTSHSNRIQQYRYRKLAKLQHDVCGLHNRVIEMKSDTKLFPSCLAAITNFF